VTEQLPVDPVGADGPFEVSDEETGDQGQSDLGLHVNLLGLLKCSIINVVKVAKRESTCSTYCSLLKC